MATPALTPRLYLQVEVGTLAPRPKDPMALPNLGTTAETPKLQPPTTAGPVRPAPIPVQCECRPRGAAGFGSYGMQPHVPGAAGLVLCRKGSKSFCHQQTAAVICSARAARRWGVGGASYHTAGRRAAARHFWETRAPAKQQHFNEQRHCDSRTE